MTRSEPAGPPAPPPASASGNDGPLDLFGAEVAPETEVTMPWFVWLILGLFAGAMIGVLFGAILAAAGHDAARYDS